MVTIVSVVGARPQFVKAAVVSRALRASPDLREVLIHTGQHYDKSMSDVFFEELGIDAPDYNLGVGSGSHGAQTGKMLELIERVLEQVRPDWVLVYGDTNSTLAGALAAAKLHIDVAHVEAGLRSFNRRMPEEINRVVTDHLSELCFTPTDAADANLLAEGIGSHHVCRVGDVMYDAVSHFRVLAKERSRLRESLELSAGGYVLATVHRAENTDDPARLETVVRALAALSATVPVVFPIHPRTRIAVERAGLADELARVMTIPPIGYLDMTQLESEARLIVTDSGGVQKEAYAHGVPCVTLRDETEWVELVELGWNELAPPRDAAELSATLLASVMRARTHLPPAPPPPNAGQRIAETILRARGGR
jgi:UDP-GlcNAc3NAcA epimerase